MLELINRTPFEAMIVPWLDQDGREFVLLLIKGTFKLGKSGAALALHDEQVPITCADQYYGEQGSSSIRYASDAFPLKKGTDVVLIGHAYAQSLRAPYTDVELRAGSLRCDSPCMYQRLLLYLW